MVKKSYIESLTKKHVA